MKLIKFEQLETTVRGLYNKFNTILQGYYNKNEVDNIVSNKADVNHTHEDAGSSNLSVLETKVSKLQDNMMDVMIYLDMINSTDVNTTGYWYDPLTSNENIAGISGLRLDTDRARIMGAPGEVIFETIDVPFNCNGLTTIINMDSNFIECKSPITHNAGTQIIELDAYTYTVK